MGWAHQVLKIIKFGPNRGILAFFHLAQWANFCMPDLALIIDKGD